ncbi:YMGG-like glycine zipper-containing protein [Thiocapsa roseopersicina]|uniref:YMGG-like Gly-zipper n=1 Tax=Thiocapsa roseopersicina TaxID=1058 RepID=A0A1H2ZUC8_THIRO|nr:YMGG-like glycine zipper-containing protein [Thiocapsa roseopersicina]SDX20289.1 YMGG-like Gly-zipper [Thiocapsa roseopersicina]
MSIERRTGKSIVVVSVSLALLQAGCAGYPTMSGGTASGVPLTPAEQRMRQQSSQLDAKTSLQGCAAGAVAGALLGMLSDGKRSNNMMIGAAAGCAVGLAANAYVQSKRQQYQNDEQRIAAMTADVRAENARISSLIATSEEVIAADRKRLAQVNAAYRNKAISSEQARRDLAGVKSNRDQLRSTVDSLKAKQQDWVDISNLERQSGTNTAQLDQEIGSLKKRISGLEQEVALMDKQINASPVAG